jgi:hypothetical protein
MVVNADIFLILFTVFVQTVVSTTGDFEVAVIELGHLAIGAIDYSVVCEPHGNLPPTRCIRASYFITTFIHPIGFSISKGIIFAAKLVKFAENLFGLAKADFNGQSLYITHCSPV